MIHFIQRLSKLWQCLVACTTTGIHSSSLQPIDTRQVCYLNNYLLNVHTKVCEFENIKVRSAFNRIDIEFICIIFDFYHLQISSWCRSCQMPELSILRYWSHCAKFPPIWTRRSGSTLAISSSVLNSLQIRFFFFWTFCTLETNLR